MSTAIDLVTGIILVVSFEVQVIEVIGKETTSYAKEKIEIMMFTFSPKMLLNNIILFTITMF